MAGDNVESGRTGVCSNYAQIEATPMAQSVAYDEDDDLEKAEEFVENQAAEQAFKSRVEQVIADLSGRSTEAEEEKQSKMQTVEPTLPTPPVTYDLTDDLVVNIDRGLQRWYQHCGRGSDYGSLFANFCEESTL